MRTSMLPGLLNMVGYNLNRGNTNVRLFEAGEVFEKLRRSATTSAATWASPLRASLCRRASTPPRSRTPSST